MCDIKTKYFANDPVGLLVYMVCLVIAMIMGHVVISTEYSIYYKIGAVVVGGFLYGSLTPHSRHWNRNNL